MCLDYYMQESLKDEEAADIAHSGLLAATRAREKGAVGFRLVRAYVDATDGSSAVVVVRDRHKWAGWGDIDKVLQKYSMSIQKKPFITENCKHDSRRKSCRRRCPSRTRQRSLQSCRI